MNLGKLKNEDLVCHTKNLIKEENRIVSKVLEHFAEIEARKLYLEWGYGSLFLFAVKYLGYSEASAQRRIDAMKFLKRIPEAKSHAEKGELTLSNLSLLEKLARESKSNHEENVRAVDLILAPTLDGDSSTKKSSKQLEEKLRDHFKLPRKKRILHIELDEEAFQLWQKTKEELGELKDAKVITKLCENLRKIKKPQVKNRQSPKARIAGTVTKRALLKKSGNQCEYVSPINGKRCESKHYLQCDHIVPYFLGGETTQKNLKILCSNHNKFYFSQFASHET
jgi:hypothetical protein